MIKTLRNIIEDINALTNYLQIVDNDFEIPLSRKVNLEQYAKKLLSSGLVVVYVDNDNIVALIGGYCNDDINKNAMISLLSVSENYRGKGLSRLLIKEMIQKSHDYGMERVYVDSVNPFAVAIYESLGFQAIKTEFVHDLKKTYLQLLIK